MQLVHTASELAAASAPWRRAAESIALVPTMGNLHDGHLSLVKRAKALADRVVVSVFVNPLQFGPNDDFDRYPRTLEADAARLRAAGADLLFAPSVPEMYPGGYPPAVSLKLLGPLNTELEGQYRPGHFDGVATVVNLLFTHVQPTVAVFGEKDWQQLAVIRQMVRDLALPVRIEGMATLREPDGLAMSSRNQYLSVEDRSKAPAIHTALTAVVAGLKAGRRDFGGLCAEQISALSTQGFRPQYVEVRKPDLSPPSAEDTEFVIVVAAHLGTTRLIDNLQVRGLAGNKPSVG
jgi:pantoate--beta-alanine ligase